LKFNLPQVDFQPKWVSQWTLFIRTELPLHFEIGKSVSILPYLIRMHTSRCTHRTQSFGKKCRSSQRYFTGEMISSKTLRDHSCRRKPLASAFSARVGWARHQFRSQLWNCLLSRNGFRVETAFGCLVLRRRRQLSSSRSYISNCRYRETIRSRLERSFRNLMPRKSPVLSCSTTSRQRGMRLAEPAIDAIFMYQYRMIPKSLYTSIWAKPHHPKKSILPWVPGLVWITNRVLYMSG
jgi:hypothetical protein